MDDLGKGGLLAIGVCVWVGVGCEMDVGGTDGSTAESFGQHEQPVLNGIPVLPDPENPEWTANIVQVGGCTGTLLDERWVLTAAHCFDTEQTVSVFHQPTNVSVLGDRIFKHPTVDAALVHMSAPMNTGFSGTIRLYEGTAESLVQQKVQVYGYGWQAVDSAFGPNCESNADCQAGYYCATDKGHWCAKPSTALRSGTFTVASLSANATEIVLPRNASEQLVAPGDSGGPVMLRNTGELVAINQWFAFDLAKSGHAAVPAFKDWVEARQNCGVFDPTDFDWGFCSRSCLCDIGEGDCESFNCDAGLACKQYGVEQRAHGFPLGYDVCFDPDCPAFDVLNPSPPVPNCEFNAGEGDCNSDDDCGGQTYCRSNIGKAMHQDASAWLDVCVNLPPSGCGWSECSPTCPCDVAQGECAEDGDCREGLVCGQGMGGYLGSGFPNVCVKLEAVRPPCESDADCPTGHCVEMVTGSASSSTGSSDVTVAGVCSTGARGELCVSSADCGTGLSCRDVWNINASCGGQYCACSDGSALD